MKQLITLAFLICTAYCYGQTEMTISHEVIISPGFVIHGEKLITNQNTYNELGSGYDISFGYTANIGWVGLSFQYYYKNNSADIDEMQTALNMTSITSENYFSNGFLAGPLVNIPVSSTNNKSIILVGFTGGMFVAHLPDQTFITPQDNTYFSYKAQAPGFAYRMQLGYRYNFNDHLGLSANLAVLSERASIIRPSYGDVPGTQYYDWKIDYPELKIGFHYIL